MNIAPEKKYCFYSITEKKREKPIQQNVKYIVIMKVTCED